MTSPTSVLKDIVDCSVCLERFTHPKVLPCQHTYCLSCLHSIARDQPKITCPHCREIHDVPQSGVKGFKDNLVIKNLLDLNLQASHVSHCGMQDCIDCQKPHVLSKCEHCSQMVCVDCRVMHNRLSWEIKTMTTTLQDIKNSQTNSQEFWRELRAQIDAEIHNVQDHFKAIRNCLEKRESKLTKSLGLIELSAELLSDECHAPLSSKQYESKFKIGKDVKSLKEAKSYIQQLKNVMTTVSQKSESVELNMDNHEDIIDNICQLGSLKYGETTIDDYREELSEIPSTSSSSTSSPERHMGNPDPVPPLPTERPIPTPRNQSERCKYSLYPEKVNYAAKLNAKVVFGPYCYLSTVDPPLHVANPNAALYNSKNNQVYISSADSNRIASFNPNGHDAKITFVAKDARDMTIGKDGNLYIAEKEGKIRRGDIEANSSIRLEEQDESTQADLIANYDEQLIAYDSAKKSIMVMNLHAQLLKSFQVEASTVISITIDSRGRIYLATEEKGRCSVLIYSLSGELLKKFDASSREMGDIAGILVDGDGYVCIARPISNRVDVYSPDHAYVRSFGSPGKLDGQLHAPTALGWMPDGGILVCDSDNNRVQIF